MKRSIVAGLVVGVILSAAPAGAEGGGCVVGRDPVGDVSGVGNAFGVLALSAPSPALDLVSLAFEETSEAFVATVEVADVDAALGTRAATAQYSVSWSFGAFTIAVRADRASGWTFAGEVSSDAGWYEIPASGSIDTEANKIILSLAWSDLGEIEEGSEVKAPYAFAEERRNALPDVGFEMPITFVSDGGPDQIEATYRTGSMCIPEDPVDEEPPPDE